jgi:hypothetical protein
MNTDAKKSARRSVSRVLYRYLLAKKAATAIPLGERLHVRSSNQPGRLGVKTRLPKKARRPYSVLLQAGLAMPALSPAQRCALTAPFHPYSGTSPERYILCGAFPQRAHRWTRRPGVTRRLVSMEPGLSSHLRSASFGAAGPLCG